MNNVGKNLLVADTKRVVHPGLQKAYPVLAINAIKEHGNVLPEEIFTQAIILPLLEKLMSPSESNPFAKRIGETGEQT